MTIASQTSRINYLGDGTTTAFAVPFYFLVNSDIVVSLTSPAASTIPQVLGTNYTLSGAGVSAGGTCTFITAPPASYTITIFRDPPVTQTTSYNNNDPFPAKSHENALDKLTMIMQRFKDRLGRTLTLADSSSYSSLALPDPVAGTYLRWRQDLVGLENTGSVTLPPNNYGIATQSEAQAGTSNTTLMTPLRTAQASVTVTPPQHRLTLATGAPVMTTNYAAQATIYSTPAVGNTIPIYNGSTFNPFSLAEMSIVLGSNWVTNSNYDVFIADDNGAKRLCTGPAWTSDSARGTGAGTTELVLVGGIYLNANAMTCRYNNTTTFNAVAQRCTYMGTVRTGAAGQVNYIFGGIGAGGVAANFGVWNAYNRVPVFTFIGDNTAFWQYAVANTWRAANASATMRASILRGLDVDGMTATYIINGSTAASQVTHNGIGINSTTSVSGTYPYCDNPSSALPLTAKWSGLLGLGYGYISAIESQSTTGASIWIGTNNGSQSGLHVESWQ